ncbi:MAG TPA: B-box zinc finger protein [Candidatus Limnocylindrales bacterium]|nr:B-box zinc finger protein [Candidatus Limnocylindrales bacterium]
MNCQNHPEVPATAYCRTCGKPVCDECRRDAFGTVYCAEHFNPQSAAAPPPPPNMGSVPPYPVVPPVAATMPPPPSYAHSDVSPPLALFLGMIPGVGAIYNGQYAKGLVHAIIWGVLMSIADSRAAHGMEPIFVMLVFAWWAYMVFEAYHTARKRRAGEPVDEYSSLLDIRGGHNVPVAGIVLILLGVLLLLRTLDVLDFEFIARFWPVLLIVAGAYLLWGRFFGPSDTAGVPHERR